MNLLRPTESTYALMNLPESLRRVKYFQSKDLSIANEMKHFCFNFHETMETDSRGIFFVGPFSTGKSSLAACMMLHFYSCRIGFPFYFSCMDFKGLCDDNKEIVEGFLFKDYIESVDFLVIDDFGKTSFENDYQKRYWNNKVFNLIEKRFANKKFTLVISHLNLSGLKDEIGDVSLNIIKKCLKIKVFK